MGKTGTRAAAGAVAAGLAAVGVGIDARSGTRPLATVTGLAGAAAYLAATFIPGVRLFGRSAQVDARVDAFALTFDDGPDPRYTPEISRILASRGHRATFFMLGRAVRDHPELAVLVVADGHEIACHGDDHGLLAFASPSELRRQLNATEQAVYLATGRLPAPLFRPPHGVRSPWLTGTVVGYGHRVCAWDGNVFDTSEPGASVIVDRVEQLLRPGAVVLLHDGDGSFAGRSRHQTVEALPAILDAAERHGLRSVWLSSLV